TCSATSSSNGRAPPFTPRHSSSSRPSATPSGGGGDLAAPVNRAARPPSDQDRPLPPRYPPGRSQCPPTPPSRRVHHGRLTERGDPAGRGVADNLAGTRVPQAGVLACKRRRAGPDDRNVT